MQESIMTFYDASETVRKRMIDEETRCFPRFFYNSIDGFYTDGRNVAFKRGLAVEVWFCFDIDGSADFKRCCLYVGEKMISACVIFL